MTTIGPIYISQNIDDWIVNNNNFHVSGERGIEFGDGWMGEFAQNHYYYGGFRFLIPSLPAGATIQSAYIEIYGNDSWNWSPASGHALRIFAEDAANPSEWTDINDHPDEGSSPRTLTTENVRWPSSGGLTWNTSGYNQSPDISSIIQALVDDYGGYSNENIIIATTTDQLYGTSPGHEVGFDDYAKSGGNVARLTITYTAAGATKELAGTIAGTSLFVSAPLLRLRPVAGSLASVSEFSASPLNRSRLFSGSLAASSTIAASPLNRLRQLTGSVAAVSAFSGALSKTAAAVIKALAGTIAAISSFAAQPLRRSRSIQGDLAASSDFAASPLNRVRNVAGSFAAVSTLASPLQRLRRFVGSFAVVSSISASPLQRLRRFAGSFASVSTFEGALSKVSHGVKALAGSIAAVSSIVGQTLKRSRKIDGSISATSDISSSPLKRSRSLKGDLAAVSSLIGSLTGGAAAVVRKLGGLLLRNVGN